MTPTHGRLHLTRTYDAPPPRLWELWTTEAGLAAWWWRHWPGTTHAVDLRVGGGYRIEAAEHGIGVRGDYLALEAPHRLLATWVWLVGGAPDPDHPGEERIEVAFAAGPTGGTSLDVAHTGPWTTPVPGDTYRQGWEFVLGELDDVLSG